MENAKAVIEALLFLSEEPLGLSRIAAGLGLTKEKAQELIEELQQDFIEQQRGLRILEVAGGYQMGSDPRWRRIRKAVGGEESGQLSNAALETLAIIAYRQPLTRLEIEEIGVSVANISWII